MKIPRRVGWMLAAFGLLDAVLLFVFLRPAGGQVAQAPPRESEQGHEKLGPPQPGEWRHRYKEPFQSFEKYAGGPVNRRSAERTTFYIRPLGGAAERYTEILERMRIYAEAFFGVPAKVLDPLPLYQPAFAADRKQWDATLLTNKLAEDVPKDALVYIGIADQDLYSEGLNYVFGEASLHLRCGVYSLVRYDKPGNLPLFTRRSLNLLAHEAGHIFSIEHCVTYKCAMQGANSLQEHDSHPMHYCPIDLQKLLWNSGMDATERYRKLLPLYEKWGCDDEAQWVARRLKP